MDNNKFEAEARTIAEAIRRFNERPEALENFESYIGYHFDVWMKKWANTPEGIAHEFEYFSMMDV